jgi:pimeloyl-ACP methyl ester carboxylesterase
MATNWSEEHVDFMGGQVHVLKGGQGDPLVVLHRDNGYPGPEPFFEELASRFTVYVPSYPGFYRSDPEAFAWIVNVRDLVSIEQQFIRKLGLESAVLVGLGFGGWIAAEIASMSSLPKQIVLVGAMGLQPKEEYIFDQFIVNTETYMRTMFHDQRHFEEAFGALPEFEWLEHWETNREQTSRIGWKPYMYNQALGKLLTEVTTPAQIVWGREDKIVPLECSQLYADGLRNSQLRIIDQCGHAVDLERPSDLARIVFDFTAKN